MKNIKIIAITLILILVALSGCMPFGEFRVVDDEIVTDCYGNVTPCINNYYTLGSPALLWSDLYCTNGAIGYLNVGTDIDVGNDVIVGNDIAVAGDIDVTNDVYIGGHLNVDEWIYAIGDITSESDINAGNDVNVTNDLDVTDNADIGGDLTIDGDLYFTTASGGLVFGDIYSNTLNPIVCTNQNQWYQVPFNVVGAYNLTIPSIANDDMEIVKTGIYLIGVAASKYCATANDFEYAIFINNGTAQIPNMVILETTIAGTKSVSSAATGIYATLTAGDTLELWVRCTDANNKTINITHADLNMTMVGR